jgi:hypothetical protein
MVYATGQREKDFRIAGAAEELPAGARVFATCTAEETSEAVGETTFQTLTDGEYYAFKARVREARERAARAGATRCAGPEARRAGRGLLARLFGRRAGRG